MRQLERSAENQRWPYDVIPTVSHRIAEVIVGNLLGGGGRPRVEFLPDLRQDLHDDNSTRSRVAYEIERILERTTASDIEATAEAIVRRVFSVLTDKPTKALFDLDRKARAAQKAGRTSRRKALVTATAGQIQTELQAAAEAPAGVPPPKRNQ